MIDGLKPYPEYKESSSPWLGRLPANWQLSRLGSVLRERGETNDMRQMGQVLSVMKDVGVIPYEEKGRVGNKKSEDTARYKIVLPDDIVVNCMNVIIGSVGLSRYTGCLSPVYYVLTRRSDANNPHYLNAVFQTKPFQRSLVRIGNGIMAHRMRIPMELLKCEPFPVPPREEQDAIVRFLGHSNERVKRAIRAKTQLISLLNEQKQAIIQQATTHGLDPNVRLSHSGVEWLGDVPEHWELLRSKYVFREVDNRSVTGEETHLSMSQELGLIPSSQIRRRLVSESYAGAKLCEHEDLVLNRLKAHLGVFALAPERGLISPDYTVFRPVREIEPLYFESIYRTPACRIELRRRAKGIVQGFWRLYTDDFYDIRVPVPPVVEQKAIMAVLDGELMTTNTVIARARREIKLLHEYLTRLVTDVVTGKIDVREAALNLPETADELEAPTTDVEAEDDNLAVDELEADRE